MLCSVDELLCFLLTFSHCQNVQVLFTIIKILLEAFNLYPMFQHDLLPDSAAVNIKGVFNTSNETKYEKEAPAGTYLIWNSCFLVLVTVILYFAFVILEECICTLSHTRIYKF